MLRSRRNGESHDCRGTCAKRLSKNGRLTQPPLQEFQGRVCCCLNRAAVIEQLSPNTTIRSHATPVSGLPAKRSQFRLTLNSGRNCLAMRRTSPWRPAWRQSFSPLEPSAGRRTAATTMIHKPWASAISGESADLRKEADLLDSLERDLVGVYAAATGLPDDRIAQRRTHFLHS
jgi:Clp protease